MIIVENITINNREFVRTYSNANMMIRKVGTEEMYSEAVDPININRTYEETDVPIVTDGTEPPYEELVENLNALGVEV